MPRVRPGILLVGVLVGALLLYRYDLHATASSPPKNRQESLISFPINSKYRQIARRVGQLVLEVPDPGGGISSIPVCTVIAINERLVLTAGHCVKDDTGADATFTKAIAVFGHIGLGDGELYELYHDPDPQDEGDDETDFVVMRTKTPIDGSTLAEVKQGGDPSAKEELFLLHHPGPSPLMLTRFECHAAEPPIDGIALRHTCDTAPGSSGAPIFDSQFELVGLHRRNGKSDDVASFNTGILLSAIRGKNANVDQVFLSASSSLPVSGSEIKQPVTAEFRLPSIGVSILQRGGTWIYRTGEADTMSSPLVEQTGDPNSFTFWYPRRDVIFQIPKSGGHARSR
jgi:V8-like Glu-specific endopeptidase